MISPLIWYVAITALGAAAWPLVFRLLPGLRDRGYAFSRCVGLLLTGYVFWLLCSLGLLQNASGSILLSVIIVLSLSVWIYRATPNGDSLRTWIVDNRRYMATVEILFAAAFVFWLIVRSFNPDLNTTEKPMELMFLNSVTNSPKFPPTDAWLAGYSISYYYFGYVLMSMLTKVTQTPVSISFNIGIALLFALTLLNSYGLVFNVISVSGRVKDVIRSSLLGPIFVGIVGNLEGLLELLRSINLPFITLEFWKWLDLEDLSDPVTGSLWPPQTWRFWWWWRASRVIRDRNIFGAPIDLQPIDEFPMFSFLLGDMHPHVLALPFVILALGLAFNVLSQKETLSRRQLVFYGICFGGLAFLNTWDFPIYLFVLAAALLLKSYRETPADSWLSVRNAVLSGGVVLVLGVAMYVLWYLGFTSQAGGILPNATYPTRFQQFLVMFGPFLIISLWFIIYNVNDLRAQVRWKLGLGTAIGLLATLIMIMLAAGLVALFGTPGNLASSIDSQRFLLENVGYSLNGMSDTAVANLVPEAIRTVAAYRLAHPVTPLILTIFVAGAVSLLAIKPPKKPDEAQTPRSISMSGLFVLILILTAVMLTLGPEFVYLRDNFGQRLNTIFKFYYAAWILFGLASACAVAIIYGSVAGLRRAALVSTAGVVILAGLIYPTFALPEKMGLYGRAITANPPTLDGLDYVKNQYPDDYAGITWLQQNAAPGSILLEAVGGSYSYFGRVSSMTGLPTLIGWANHESQWRGSLFGSMADGRDGIVHEIYDTTSVVRAKQLIEENHVTFVFVGSLERDPSYASAQSIAKFDRMLVAVFRQGNVVIYRTDLPLAEGQK